jgi:hypothetical protein
MGYALAKTAMSLETTLYLIVISILVVGAVYEFRKQDDAAIEVLATSKPCVVSSI